MFKTYENENTVPIEIVFIWVYFFGLGFFFIEPVKMNQEISNSLMLSFSFFEAIIFLYCLYLVAMRKVSTIQACHSCYVFILGVSGLQNCYINDDFDGNILNP